MHVVPFDHRVRESARAVVAPQVHPLAGAAVVAGREDLVVTKDHAVAGHAVAVARDPHVAEIVQAQIFERAVRALGKANPVASPGDVETAEGEIRSTHVDDVLDGRTLDDGRLAGRSVYDDGSIRGAVPGDLVEPRGHVGAGVHDDVVARLQGLKTSEKVVLQQ